MAIIGLDFGNFNTFPCFIQGMDENTRRGGTEYPLLSYAFVDGIPSAYFYSRKAGILIGRTALGNRAIPAENRLRYIKRDIGKTVQIDDKTISIDDVITEVVQYCVRIANERMRDEYHQTTNKISLAYPVRYTQLQKRRLVEQVEKATLEDGTHLQVVGTISEPAAAALCYLASEASTTKNTTALVYDLGGGTFDASLVTAYPNGINDNGVIRYYDVVNAVGIEDLGGKEFDDELIKLLREKAENDISINFMPELRNVANAAKHDLSEEPETTVLLPQSGEPVTITRKEFETRTKHLLDKTIEETKSLYNRHLNQKPDVIILTGGSSHMPMVKTAMEAAFPEYKDRIFKFKTSSSIAFGAARYGTADNNTPTPVIQRLNYDYGIIFQEKDNSEKKYVEVYLKEGTPIPCNSEWKESITPHETTSVTFRGVEATKKNPNKFAIDTDFKEIVGHKFEFGTIVPRGYKSESRIVIDDRGLLSVEGREKDNPSKKFKTENVELEKLQ